MYDVNDITLFFCNNLELNWSIHITNINKLKYQLIDFNVLNDYTLCHIDTLKIIKKNKVLSKKIYANDEAYNLPTILHKNTNVIVPMLYDDQSYIINNIKHRMQ